MNATPSSKVKLADSNIIVKAEKVNKHFGALHVLKDIDMEVRKNEVVVIIGPSGSGKSTFLRCINHLEKINSGHIYVNGHMIGYHDRNGRLVEDSEKNIARQRAEIGMVFQRFNLFPHFTAFENIMEAPVRVRKTPLEQARADAERLLTRVGLSDKRDQYPNQLSGGQQQRVAIARALAMKPSLMLFDEPTSALDPEMIGEVLDVMKELAHEMTMIVVSHEMGFARAAANRIIFIDDGQIIEQAAPDEFFRNPREERTRLFLSQILH
jgi:polar amino acid transport system ATP-binding protein